MKGNEKSGEDEILEMTHDNKISPTNSHLRSSEERSAQKRLWLGIRSGGEKETKTMKERGSSSEENGQGRR